MYDRETNASYLNNNRTLTVQYDIQQANIFSRKRRDLELKKIKLSMLDTLTINANSIVKAQYDKIEQQLSNPDFLTKVIDAKERVTIVELNDSSFLYSDSSKNEANAIIHRYQQLLQQQALTKHLCDSLKTLVIKNRQEIESIWNGHIDSKFRKQQNNIVYDKFSKHYFNEVEENYLGIRSFSIGTSVPNYSSLTLQNSSVNGINIEYNNKIYLAVVAGSVNKNIGEYFGKGHSSTIEHIYAGRIGVGSINKNNFIITFYQGTRILGYNPLQDATPLRGISVAGQMKIIYGIRVYGEIAHSNSPRVQSEKESFLNLSDKSQHAFNLGVSGYFPKTGGSFQGDYKFLGLHHYDFTGYKFNAASNAIKVNIVQPLWHQHINLSVGLNKNSFSNPEVLQRYKSDVLYKNISVSFRKENWPFVSVGFIPSSQYTIIDNILFENRYQTLSADFDYSYTIEQEKCSSKFLFSQLFNDHQDSQLIYYNSKNFYFEQNFSFPKFTSKGAISVIQSPRYTLCNLEGSWGAQFFKFLYTDIDFKISKLNNGIAKLGYRSSATIKISKMGNFNFLFEKSFLPDNLTLLKQHQLLNIQYTRYL